MSTYEELIGKRVEFFDSDPTLTTAYEGQVWYNTTSDTLKTVVVKSAFSSGANMVTARRGVAGAVAGSKTAGLGFGGYTGSSAGLNLTEEYNGSGFSTGGALNKARYALGGAGTQTAGLAVGGFSNPGQDTEVEEYNGTSWSEVTDVPAAKSNYVAALGTQTAALFCGGIPTPTTTTYLYDGTNWTTSGALNTAGTSGLQGAGTQTAAVAAGRDVGGSPGVSLATEEFDGSSWTTVNNCPSPTAVSAGGAGIQTDAIFMKGTNSSTYDGTNFATGPSMANDFIEKVGNGATVSTAIAFSGRPPSSSTGYTGTSEEFNRSATTVVAAAWANGGSLGTARDSGGSAGTQTAALYFGGYLGSLSAHTESYNGTSWSELNDLNTAKRQVLQGLGTQTAALAFGGLGAPGVSTQLSGTESWNGSSWTALSSPSNQNTAKHNLGSVGTQTAGLKFGGNASYSSATESWNGSAWTTKNSLNTGRTGIRGSGTSTAAIGIGGSSPTVVASVESWDGTNWTASPYSLNTANYVMGCAGPSQTAALIFGGITPVNPVAAISEIFDGSTFSTSPNLATQRYNLGGCGTVSAALAFGGQAPPYSNATEEFTPESTTVTASTLTTS